MFSVNPRLEKAVIDAAARTPKKSSEEPASQPVQPANVVAALKGVSSSLLEKVRDCRIFVNCFFAKLHVTIV